MFDGVPQSQLPTGEPVRMSRFIIVTAIYLLFGIALTVMLPSNLSEDSQIEFIGP